MVEVSRMSWLNKICMAFALCGLLFAVPAMAQSDKDQDKETKTSTEPTGPKRFVFGEEDVAGTVRKPQVEYIIARGDTGDETELKLDKSFVPELLKSVKRKPF